MMTMKKILIFVLSFVALCLTSCSTRYYDSLQPPLQEAFAGRSYAEIIDALGAPDRTTPDGRGGNILIYEDISFYTQSAANSWTNSIASVTTANKGYVHLYVDSSNHCYTVRTNKINVRDEFSLGKTIGLGASMLTFIAVLLLLT